MHRNRSIKISCLHIVLFLLTTATAAEKGTNQTHRLNPRFQHAYYSYPHRPCKSFSRPYARSMCIELEKIHRSSRQPLVFPPLSPPEIDQRQENKITYVELKKKRARVPSRDFLLSFLIYEAREQGANSEPMGPALVLWKEREMDKTRKKYEMLSEKIMLWEDKKKKKAKRELHRTERCVEKAKLKAKQRFVNDNERIEIVAASARTHAYESQTKEELKVKEKANLMRTTGKNPCSCL